MWDKCGTVEFVRSLTETAMRAFWTHLKEFCNYLRVGCVQLLVYFTWQYFVEMFHIRLTRDVNFELNYDFYHLNIHCNRFRVTLRCTLRDAVRALWESVWNTRWKSLWETLWKSLRDTFWKQLVLNISWEFRFESHFESQLLWEPLWETLREQVDWTIVFIK